MDADWSVEIGEGLPSIDVPWQGWVDLRDRAGAADRLRALPEVAEYPELLEVLLAINSHRSVVVTSKCDVFLIDAGEDLPCMMEIEEPAPSQEERQTPTLADDAERRPEHALAAEEPGMLCGLGSYLDLALTPGEPFASFAACEALARRITIERLAPIAMPRTSVELVLRESTFFGSPGFGFTLYATGFGRNATAARTAWAEGMRLSAYITLEEVAGSAPSQA